MTPNDIEILIHYHVCPKVHPRDYAPAVKQSINKFLRDGIIKHDSQSQRGHHYTTTEKGRAWLEMILKTPYPKQVRIDEKGCLILNWDV